MSQDQAGQSDRTRWVHCRDLTLLLKSQSDHPTVMVSSAHGKNIRGEEQVEASPRISHRDIAVAFLFGGLAGTVSAACLACMAGMHGCWYGMGTVRVLPMVRSCTYHALSSGLRLLKEGRDCGAALHGMGLYMCVVSPLTCRNTYLPS